MTLVAESDIKDMLTALSAAGVDHVVVGAHALAAHGRVRATGDIDILVAANHTNATRLERAIRQFADASLEYFGVSVAELSVPRVGFYLGVEPDRIDIMTSIAGVRFDRASRGAMACEIAGVSTMVLGFEDLIAAKRASIARRPVGSAKALQDAADLEWLRAERARRQRS